jgi:hypothetical protein
LRIGAPPASPYLDGLEKAIHMDGPVQLVLRVYILGD